MRKWIAMAAASAFLIAATAASAVTWSGYQVGRIVPPDTRDCVFFQLSGVSQADPAVPGGLGWFVVPRSALGFKEIYALLLTAKASGIPLTVETTGAAVSTCANYAGVWQIYTTD